MTETTGRERDCVKEIPNVELLVSPEVDGSREEAVLCQRNTYLWNF